MDDKVWDKLNRQAEADPPSESDRDPYDIALDKGYSVIASHPSMLQVDLDTPRTQKQEGALLIFLQWLGGHGRLVTTSPGGNKHEYYRVDARMSRMERMALQLALGSDPKRELLNHLRPARPMVLFETAEEAARVRAWWAAGEPKEEDDVAF